MRSMTIFQLFIVTGRDSMAREARENMNIRPSCDNWKPRGDTQTNSL